jgi:hypothetical protein
METLFDLKPYQIPELDYNILVIDLCPHETKCGICGCHMIVPYYGGYYLPMYEGKVVNPDIQKEWGGFSVCSKCYHENEYKMYLDAFGIPRDQPL